jgi:hypothetical protein
VAEASVAAPRRSKLVLAGVILIAASFLLPQAVFRAANQIQAYGPRLAVTLLGDLLLSCFFIGIGALIIGALRNRRWKAETARSESKT